MTVTNPSEIITRFLADADLLGEVIATGGDWSTPSPCEGWSAADVLDHIIDSERAFIGRYGIDLGPAPTGEPAQRWQAHLAVLRGILTDEVMAIEYDGLFGHTTVGETLRDFYGFDLLVHRWDIGTALGQRIELSPQELDRLEARVPEPGSKLYDFFYSPQVCKPPVPVAAGVPRQTEVLAKLGRRA